METKPTPPSSVLGDLEPDLSELAALFAEDDIEWKPGAVTRDATRGLAMAYISSRAVMDRLDVVAGPGNWRNEFRAAPEGGVLCGISILITRRGGSSEWVTKWDGAENTDREAVKGGLSGAMKRAAVQWGIGRYLYRLPRTWVRLDERGRFAEPPRIPREFLPLAGRRSAPNGTPIPTAGDAQRAAIANDRRPPQPPDVAPMRAPYAAGDLTPPQRAVADELERREMSEDDRRELLSAYRAETVADLSPNTARRVLEDVKLADAAGADAGIDLAPDRAPAAVPGR